MLVFLPFTVRVIVTSMAALHKTGISQILATD